MLGSVVLLGSDSFAQTTHGQFGLRLVIEPACPKARDTAQAAGRAAADASDAISIARQYLRGRADFRYLAQTGLTAEHDLADTGNWIIRAGGIEEPILRIEKCSGLVTPLFAA